MARPNRPRTVGTEESLARRIRAERERRDWTYEALAKRMEGVGCPIQPSAIFKIEKGKPRRRVTVDEFVALANVFALDLTDLLLPLELVNDREARRLLDEYIEADAAQGAAKAQASQAFEALHALVERRPETFEAVSATLRSWIEQRSSSTVAPLEFAVWEANLRGTAADRETAIDAWVKAEIRERHSLAPDADLDLED